MVEAVPTSLHGGKRAFCWASAFAWSSPFRNLPKGLGRSSCPSQIVLASSPSSPSTANASQPWVGQNAVRTSPHVADGMMRMQRSSRCSGLPLASIRKPMLSSWGSTTASRRISAASNRSSADPLWSSRADSRTSVDVPSSQTSPMSTPSSMPSITVCFMADVTMPSFIVRPCHASTTLSIPSRLASGSARSSGHPSGVHTALRERMEGNSGGSMDNARW